MIRLDRPHPGVLVLTLARPEKRNAISLSMLDDIAAALDAEADLDALVITGTPELGVFSAGFDRDDLAAILQGGGSAEGAAGKLHALFERLERAPYSVVTAVNGLAIGGGCELALTGDVRIAAPRSTFTLPPAKLGIVYPPPGMDRLRENLGTSLLRAMLVTAQPFDASRLVAVGAIHELAEATLDRAVEVARWLTRLPRASRAANRAALLAPRLGC